MTSRPFNPETAPSELIEAARDSIVRPLVIGAALGALIIMAIIAGWFWIQLFGLPDWS